MKFTKPPLSLEKQAELLLSRGLRASPEDLVGRLRAVSYYRLSQYLYPYRKPGCDDYQPDTSIDVVWQHYVFESTNTCRFGCSTSAALIVPFSHKFLHNLTSPMKCLDFGCSP